MQSKPWKCLIKFDTRINITGFRSQIKSPVCGEERIVAYFIDKMWNFELSMHIDPLIVLFTAFADFELKLWKYDK